jgi:hypothetical protein
VDENKGGVGEYLIFEYKNYEYISGMQIAVCSSRMEI